MVGDDFFVFMSLCLMFGGIWAFFCIDSCKKHRSPGGASCGEGFYCVVMEAFSLPIPLHLRSR